MDAGPTERFDVCPHASDESPQKPPAPRPDVSYSSQLSNQALICERLCLLLQDAGDSAASKFLNRCEQYATRGLNILARSAARRSRHRLQSPACEPHWEPGTLSVY